MPDIEIYGEKIRRGERRHVRIPIRTLPAHLDIDLNVIVYRGQKEGPTLLLSAGMHGDEINGVEIMRQLTRSRALVPDAGTVVAVPIINLHGFAQTTRLLPDGEDLNRKFPGNAKGTFGERLAHAITHHLLPAIDYGLDFHTGGASRSNVPQIRCAPQEFACQDLGEMFGAPFVVHTELIEHSFRETAYQMGKSVLVYEGGESMRVDAEAVAIGVRGARRVIHHLGLKSFSADPTTPPIVLPHNEWVRAGEGGFFLPTVALGHRVQRGQKIGTLADPFGHAAPRPVSAPAAGYVISVNYHPVVQQGEALVQIGQEAR